MQEGSRKGGETGAHAAGDAAEDPYLLLGVPRGASLLDVKRGYRERVKACHPDLGSEPWRVEEFKKLTRAYKALTERLSSAAAAGASAAAAPANGTAAAAAAHHHGPAAPQPQHAPGQPGATRRDPAADAETRALGDLVTAGRARLAARDYDAAESMARAALARSRQFADAYVLMGETLAARGQFAEATGCFSLALQLAPNNQTARDQLQRLRNRE